MRSANSPTYRSTRPRRWVVTAVVGLFAISLAAAAYWWPRPKPSVVPAANRNDDDLDEPRVDPNPGYVGMQACAACHVKRVTEFQTTKHFIACREPEPGMMAPGFAPGQGSFATREPPVKFQMSRQGTEFFQTNTRMTRAGEQRYDAKIGLIYGSSGRADELYFSWHGDRLYELPVTWLHPLGRWRTSPFNPFGNSDLSRTTTTRCLECHNTWVEHVPGTENRYKRDHMILGVTCEKCHGPGRDHVAYHTANPKAESASAIVHPGHLSRERQMDVCGQCHSNTTKPRGPAFRYRPGETLEAHFRTALVPHRENDHVIDQGKYLRQSKCFQKSEMTCATCHDPHKPTAPGAGQKSCQKCHQPHDCREQPRLPAAVRGDCVGCHMPQFTRIQVYFHTEDDRFYAPVRPKSHRIAVSPTATQEVLLAWHRTQPDDANRKEAARLTAALVNHWLADADAMRREYRFMAALAALREVRRLDPSPAHRAKFDDIAAITAKLQNDLYVALNQRDERRFPEAIATLKGILEVKPDAATAHGQLGTLYAVTGQKDLSVRHLHEAAKCDPDDPYGYAMLGWLAYLDNQPADALTFLRKADEIEPYRAKVHYHMGLALAKLKKWPDAAEIFRRALVIDPNHAEAAQALSQALRQDGQTDDGLRAARRAAKLSENQNPDILMNLADAYADAGRFTEARDTAARAAEIARTKNPQLLPQLLRRVEEFRARAKTASK